MTTIRLIPCHNCNKDNYVDVDIVDKEMIKSSVGTTENITKFLHHCTFCGGVILDPEEAKCPE